MTYPIISLIVLGALLYFVLLWCGIVYLISFISGWQKLAKSFATTEQPLYTGRCSCLFKGKSKYGNTVNYASTKQGLYLRTLPIFSLGHKPLFIPWSAFESYESGNFSWFYRVRFRVDGITVLINEDVRAIQKQA